MNGGTVMPFFYFRLVVASLQRVQALIPVERQYYIHIILPCWALIYLGVNKLAVRVEMIIFPAASGERQQLPA
jgi:hypothetical protein